MPIEDVISYIATYVLDLLFLVAAHVFAASMDYELYKYNKYKYYEDRKKIKIGCKIVFWRFKKEDNKEMFVVAFIHQIINIIIFILITIMLVITLLTGEYIIMFLSVLIAFSYNMHCGYMGNYFKNRNKS